MSDFLIILLQCSVTMSVLIITLIALTPWLSKRYTAKWLYYVWTVIVIGLIIPFRFHPETPLIDANKFFRTNESSTHIQSTIPEDTGEVFETTVQTTSEERAFQISWYQTAGFIWIIGVIAFIFTHGMRHYRFNRCVIRWSEDESNPEIYQVMEKVKSDMGITEQVKLKRCPWITSPMLTGFVKPVILLPQINITEIELSYILRHELVHYKRKDIWYKSLVIFATAIHWFNPIIYLMAKAINFLCEISCDEEVIKDKDWDCREKYSETILGVIKRKSSVKTAFSTSFYEGKKSMKRRIVSIMDTTKKKASVLALAIIFIGTLGSGMVFAADKKEANDAYPTSTTTLLQEQELPEQEEREAKAEHYTIYEKYGLIYDKSTDSFYYDGKLVRYFSDKLDSNDNYTVYTNWKGLMDIKAVRDADYKLVGIEPVSQEEYDKHTESFKRMENMEGVAQEITEVDTSEISGYELENIPVTYATELAETTYVDNPFIDYLDYGITYDFTNMVWTYNNKPINFFRDGNNFTYVDNREVAVKNGVSIEVIRTADGQIEKLEELP